MRLWGLAWWDAGGWIGWAWVADQQGGVTRSSSWTLVITTPCFAAQTKPNGYFFTTLTGLFVTYLLTANMHFLLSPSQQTWPDFLLSSASKCNKILEAKKPQCIFLTQWASSGQREFDTKIQKDSLTSVVFNHDQTFPKLLLSYKLIPK